MSPERASYDPSYYRRFSEIERKHFWFRSRGALIVWALRKFARPLNDYLEIGCGTGNVLAAVGEAFPGTRLTGSEIYREGLEFARERVPRAALVEADARRLPFHGAFDAVGAFDVFEHIEDDRSALASARGALKPGGVLIATVPLHPRLWSGFDEFSRHVRRYRTGELEKKAGKAGLEVLDSVPFMSLLLPAVWASRRRGAEDGWAHLRAASAANSALEAVMALERALVRAGVRFRSGASLLIAARRRN